jgi:putative iron-dependent peroxidase
MIAQLAQPAILAPAPESGRSLVFRIALEADPRPALRRLVTGFDPAWGVVGIGEPLARALGAEVPGLRGFPALSGPGYAIPSTQQALWIFLRAAERGPIFERSERLDAMLEDALILDDAMDTFANGSRDLTGYVDGTANPGAEDSISVALVAAGAGLAGSSFVAVQRWAHDLRRFRGHFGGERDLIIGRRLSDNAEIADAPPSAHVKRTEQESFDPPAFVVRRSMPWAGARDQGLEFIAYGCSLDPFERQLRRMAGLDDGIADALFRFSRPLTGGYYWCPPLAGGKLDGAPLRL